MLHRGRLCLASFKKALKGKCGYFNREAFSHAMSLAGPFPFCALCGAHTRVSLRKLATRCPKRVTSAAMQPALDRMRLGQCLAEDLFLGQPSTFVAFSPPAELQGGSMIPGSFSLAEVIVSVRLGGRCQCRIPQKNKSLCIFTICSHYLSLALLLSIFHMCIHIYIYMYI